MKKRLFDPEKEKFTLKPDHSYILAVSINDDPLGKPFGVVHQVSGEGIVKFIDWLFGRLTRAEQDRVKAMLEYQLQDADVAASEQEGGADG